MKKLTSYLNALPIASRAAFATRCGASFDYLRQIAYGNRRCREAIAICIERESRRAITCEELRPDVDWAYIRATDPGCDEGADTAYNPDDSAKEAP